MNEAPNKSWERAEFHMGVYACSAGACVRMYGTVYTYSNLEQMCGQARTIAGVA